MKCGAYNGRRKETEVGEARGTDIHGWEGFFSCLGAIPCGAQSLLLPLNSGIIPGGLRGDVKIQPKQAKCKARVLPTGPQESILSMGKLLLESPIPLSLPRTVSGQRRLWVSLSTTRKSDAPQPAVNESNADRGRVSQLGHEIVGRH